MRQAANVRIQTFVFVQWLNRNPPPNTGTHDLAGEYSRLRANHRAALHPNMIAKAHLSANNAIIFDRHAAADARWCGNDYALTNVAVVTDMDHIVELCAFADA